MNALLQQIRDRNQSNGIISIDQRFENLIISLAYLAVELDSKCKVLTFMCIYRLTFFFFISLFKIRIQITEVLLDFYQKLSNAEYYDIASFEYKHSIISSILNFNELIFFLYLVLPPAEVFSFSLHTALTELAATSDDGKLRDKVNRDEISSRGDYHEVSSSRLCYLS